MAHGEVIQSDRSNILEYVPGKYLDEYSALHPTIVRRNLQIQEGLEISKSELPQTYLRWVQDHFDENFVRPEMHDLHILYLHLLACQGVDEDGPVFRGAGLRP